MTVLAGSDRGQSGIKYVSQTDANTNRLLLPEVWGFRMITLSGKRGTALQDGTTWPCYVIAGSRCFGLGEGVGAERGGRGWQAQRYYFSVGSLWPVT